MHVSGKDENSNLKKNACTHVYLSALYTIVNRRKQPKCPSINEWINTHTHTHTHTHSGILLSHKKEKIMPSAAIWIDPEVIILSK